MLLKNLQVPFFALSLIFSINSLANGIDSISSDKPQALPCKLRVAWSPWPPFIDGKNTPRGIHIDFLKWVSNNMNCQLVFQKMTWAESVNSIKKGETDLLGRASLVEERRSFALFSEPYRESLILLYVRYGVPREVKASTIEDLLKQGFKIGLQAGAYYGDDVAALKNNPAYKNNFPEFPFTDGPPAHLLLDGTIDGLLESPFTMDSISLKSTQRNLIEEFPLEIFSEKLHFMFSKKTTSPDFVNKFNQAIQEVRNTPEYQTHWYWKSIK